MWGSCIVFFADEVIPMPTALPSPSDSRIDPQTLLAPIRRLSFWLAVGLPFALLLLLLSGLGSPTETGTFLVLFALNLVTLVVGHGHGGGDGESGATSA
ncbi:hypothetical protein [Haloarchaeobius sp. DFWS5]|uniref:hypothetical protein n=1 Tax=Haloarchaeobius sp. DFWS5 TaxID=3446114 RepID=UPI003EBF8A73